MWKERSIARAINRLCFSQRRLCTKTEKEEFVALFQKRERGHNLPTLPTKRGPGPNTISCQSLRQLHSSTSNETGGEGDGRVVQPGKWMRCPPGVRRKWPPAQEPL